MCSSSYDISTSQRTDVNIDLVTGKKISELKTTDQSSVASGNIFPRAISINEDSENNRLYILWEGDTISTYDLNWVKAKRLNSSEFSTPPPKSDIGINKLPPLPRKVRWGGNNNNNDSDGFSISERELTPNSAPFNLHDECSITYKEMVGKDNTLGMRDALAKLQKYGILLVKDTPSSKHDILAFCGSLSGGSVKEYSTQSVIPTYLDNPTSPDWGKTANEVTDGPMKTPYGQLWSTNSEGMELGQSVADSAYSNDALPVHTDSKFSFLFGW